jgi:hypothetical protein
MTRIIDNIYGIAKKNNPKNRQKYAIFSLPSAIRHIPTRI